MPTKKIGSLQIDPSAASQSLLFWHVQRVVVFFLVLFLIAVALGLTGPGLLDKRVVGDKNGPIWISYDKFARANATTILSIHVNDNNLLQLTPVKIAISENYFSGQYLKQITPTPIKSEVIDNKLIYTFMLAGSSTINFVLEPQKSGSVTAQFNLVDAPDVLTLTQYFFP